jgi:hypothetical protein
LDQAIAESANAVVKNNRIGFSLRQSMTSTPSSAYLCATSVLFVSPW